MLERADITTDPAGAEARPGVPLAITFAVSRIDGTSCVPLEGALVDIWHCDADGVYSDVQGEGAGHQWLRGYQVSDANGTAAFQTIYPGWYQGRTVHIHFKIRTDAGAASGTEFTAQLYFDDAVSDEVYAREPYASNGERSTRNANDGIYGQGGDQLTLAVTGDPDAGYAARFEIGLQTA
jgi:protocatechuate 3,4-dioxygenase beta subunit